MGKGKGKEKDLQLILRNIAEGNYTDPPLPMPQHGYGSADGSSTTFNQKGNNCAVWAWQTHLGLDVGGDGIQRARQFLRDTATAGHCALGNVPPEPLSQTHGQLNMTWPAALLLLAYVIGDGEMVRTLLDWWRVEYAARHACRAVIDGKRVNRPPGARDFKKNEQGEKVVMLVNSLCDDVIAALEDGVFDCPEFPHVAKQGGYEVAALYMAKAVEDGYLNPKDITEGASYEPLTKRYGFNVVRAEKRDDFYAWYAFPIASVPTNESEQPNPALDPVHGVGVVGGRLFWRVSVDEALATAERVQRLGRVVA